MQNQTNKLASLITYTGLKRFLEEYHTSVKNEFGQYLGINKALICVAKVFGEAKSKVFTAELQKIEEQDLPLLTVRKEIFNVIVNEKIDDYKIETTVSNFTSYEKMESFIRSEFSSKVAENDSDKDSILDHFDTFYSEDELDELREMEVDEMVDHIADDKNVYIDSIIKAIDSISYNYFSISYEREYIDIEVKPSDLK